MLNQEIQDEILEPIGVKKPTPEIIKNLVLNNLLKKEKLHLLVL